MHSMQRKKSAPAASSSRSELLSSDTLYRDLTDLRPPVLRASTHVAADLFGEEVVYRSLMPSAEIETEVHDDHLSPPVYRCMTATDAFGFPLSPAASPSLSSRGLDFSSMSLDLSLPPLTLGKPSLAGMRGGLDMAEAFSHLDPKAKAAPRVYDPHADLDALESVEVSDESFEGYQPSPLSDDMPFLERHSHFYSTTSPVLLMATMLTLLRAHNIDYTLVKDKFKVKCEAYFNAARLSFHIRVFAVGDKYAVEFQRREGDVVAFCELYRGAVAELRAQHCVVDSGVASGSTSSSCPAPCASLPRVALPRMPIDVSTEASKDGLQHLAKMLVSDFSDVKLNGVQAIALICADLSENRQMVVQLGIADNLVDCLKSSSSEVRRAGATALANLSQDCHAASIRLLACKAVDALVDIVEQAVCKESVREAARTLCNMANAVGDSMLSVKLKASVQKLMRNKDQRARHHARSLASTLRVPEMSSHDAVAFG